MSKGSAVILDFWKSQSSVATQVRWDRRPCNFYIEFPWESRSERVLKIGLHIPKLWSKVKCIVFWDSVYRVKGAVAYRGRSLRCTIVLSTMKLRKQARRMRSRQSHDMGPFRRDVLGQLLCLNMWHATFTATYVEVPALQTSRQYAG